MTRKEAVVKAGVLLNIPCHLPSHSKCSSQATIVNNGNRRDLTHDFILPTLLFAALGGMAWAVRGCSGFGAMKVCIFAGVTWGTAWWFIAHDPSGAQSRRYASAWIILALAAGIGISGSRGWMQWPSFFGGHIQLNQKEVAPISPAYGFL